jgi:hypothetical protein
MKKIALLSMVCASVFPTAALTYASYDKHRPNYLPASRYIDNKAPSAAARLGCLRMCENDLLPCDPWSFKQADGRCPG